MPDHIDKLIKEFTDRFPTGQHGYKEQHELLMKDLSKYLLTYIDGYFGTPAHLAAACKLINLFMLFLLFLERNPTNFIDEIDKLYHNIKNDLEIKNDRTNGRGRNKRRK